MRLRRRSEEKSYYTLYVGNSLTVWQAVLAAVLCTLAMVPIGGVEIFLAVWRHWPEEVSPLLAMPPIVAVICLAEYVSYVNSTVRVERGSPLAELAGDVLRLESGNGLAMSTPPQDVAKREWNTETTPGSPGPPCLSGGPSFAPRTDTDGRHFDDAEELELTLYEIGITNATQWTSCACRGNAQTINTFQEMVRELGALVLEAGLLPRREDD